MPPRDRARGGKRRRRRFRALRPAVALCTGVLASLAMWSVARADGIISPNSTDRYFSPNGDDQEDTVEVFYCLSEPANVVAEVLGSGGAQIKVLDAGSSHAAGCSNFVSWDGTNDVESPVPDGVYDYRIVATGGGGSDGELTGQLGVDRRIPGRITSPAPDDTLTGTTEVVFTPTVGFTGITEVCVLGVSEACSTEAEAGGEFLIALDTTLLTDGAHQLEVRVAFTDQFDQTHSYTSEPVAVTISNPPRISLVNAEFGGPDRSFSPNGDGQEDTVNVTYCLSEDANVTITISDGVNVVRTIGPDQRSAGYAGFFCSGVPFDAANAFTWDGLDDEAAPVPDGVYTYVIHAVDGGGSGTQSEAGHLEVQTDVPGRITSPAPDDTLTGTTDVVFTPTPGFAGITEVCVRPQFFDGDCETVPEGDGTYRVQVVTTALSDGPYQLDVRVAFTDQFDQPHSYTSDPVAVTISNPPRITRLAAEFGSADRAFSPNGDGQEDTVGVTYCLSEDATVTVTISDGGGVVRTIETDVPHGAGGPFPCSPFVSDNGFEWDGRDDQGDVVTDGVYTYRIVATDAGDARGEASGQLQVETDVPGTVTAPAPGTLSGTVDVIFTPTTGFSGIGSVCVEGVFPSACDFTPEGDGTYRIALDTTTIPDGPFQLRARVSFNDDFFNPHSYLSNALAVTIANPPQLKLVAIDGFLIGGRAFSPNSDEQEDTTRVSYCLTEDATLTITIRDAGDAVVRTIEDDVAHVAGFAEYSCGGPFVPENAFTWGGRDDLGEVVPNGLYTFRIVATDAGGASSEVTGDFAVDARVPGAVTTPAPDDTLTGTQDLVFTPTTGFTGITRVDFCFDAFQCATVFAPTPAGVWRTTFDTTQLENGPAILRTTVSFNDGFDQPHTYAAPEVPVEVDQTSPLLTLTATPVTGQAPLPVNFTIDASSPIDATLDYSLDFGDGTTAATGQIGPPYNDVNVPHTYQLAGSFRAVVTVSDGQGQSAQRSVSISVTQPADRPPTASLSVTPTAGHAPLQVASTIGGGDLDNDPLTYSLDFGDGSSVQQGSLPVAQPVPHTYQNPGLYTVTLTVSDGHPIHDATDTETVTVTENRTPVASLSVDPLSGETPLQVSATIGGTDDDRDPLTYSLDFADGSPVQTGSLPHAAPITHTFLDAGSFTVRLTVSDGLATSDPVTATVEVTQNVAPLPSLEVTPTSGLAPLSVSATIGGTDDDGDTLTYTLDFDDGSAVLMGQLPAGPFEHTYMTGGSFTVKLTVSDGRPGHDREATQQVTVTQNRAPVPSLSVTPLSGRIPLLVEATIGGTDADHDPLDYTLTFGDGSPALTGQLPVADPIAHTYSGSGTFPVTLTVSDGHVSVLTTRTVTALANAAPDAVDDAIRVRGSAPVTKNVIANDSDPDDDPFEVVGHTDPDLGDVTCTATSCTYTPHEAATEVTTDRFTYTIRDAAGLEATAQVLVTLLPDNPNNHAPFAVNDKLVAHGTGPQTIDVLLNDTDLDDDPLSISRFQNLGARLTCGGGSCTYTPDGRPTDSFWYEISDGQGGFSKATVDVRIRPNGVPLVEPDEMTVHGTGSGDANVLFNDLDPDGEDLTLSAVDPQPEHGTVVCGGTGGFADCTYTATDGLPNTDRFGYRVDDGHGGTATTFVDVTIEADRVPVPRNDRATGHGHATFTIDVLRNDGDPDGDSLSIVQVTGSPNVDCLSTICFYTPPAGAVLPFDDSFTYKVDDGHGKVSDVAATVTVRVDMDQPPVARDDRLSAPGTAAGFTAFGEIRPLINDYDPEGDELDIISFTQPVGDHGTSSCYFVMVWRCAYTPQPGYQPVPGESPDDRFTYTITDNHGREATATILVEILANHGPDALDDDVTAHGDGAEPLPLLGNDTDPDGDELFVSDVGPVPAGEGSVACNEGGCAYHPPAGYDGPWPLETSFSYTASDERGGFDTATVRITLVKNQPPIPLPDRGTARYRAPASIAILDNDTDPEGDKLDIVGFTQPADGHGSVFCLLTKSGWRCVYAAPPGFFDSETFTYTVSDGHGGEAVGTVRVTVVANHAPVAGDDEISVTERRLAQIQLPNTNDVDPDGDQLRLYDYSDAQHGTVDCHADGKCTYFPTPDDPATEDSFTYRVTDDFGGFDIAIVTVTIRENQPPVAVEDAFTVVEHRTTTLNVTGDDQDVDQDPLKVTSWTQPANGTVQCDKPPRKACTYGLDAAYTGPYPLTETFTYTITDGRSGESTAEVTVTVVANEAPDALDDTGSTRGVRPITIDVVRNDSDPNQDPLTIQAFDPAGLEGEVTCFEHVCDYTPPEDPSTGYPFVEGFTYTVDDGFGLQDTATVTVTTFGNRAPTAQDDSGTGRTGRELRIEVVGNDEDPDDDVLTIIGLTQPTHGVAACPGLHGAETACSYTPDAGYLGPDEFTYTVEDPFHETSTATVRVEVTENHALDAVDDEVTVPRSRPTSIDVLGNDVDEDGDPKRIIRFDPQFPTLTAENGRVSCTAFTCWYVPDPNHAGPFPYDDTFTYVATDGFGPSDGATVTVHVQDNRPPIAMDDAATVHGVEQINVLANDTDPDGDDLVDLTYTPASDGTVVCDQDEPLTGYCTYTPPHGFSGVATFTYTIADDPWGATSTATVRITVIGNHAPEANPDRETIADTSPVFINVRANDEDDDGDFFTVVPQQIQTAHGSVDCNAEGCTYTADAEFGDCDSFAYRLTDGQDESEPAIVTVAFEGGSCTASVGIASNHDPSVFGQPVTFTATVSVPGETDPAGSATFFDDTTVLGTGTVSGGVATFTTSSLAVGTHPITAAFVGSGGSSGVSATSAVLDQDVDRGSTSVTLTSSKNPQRLGDPVTFTATVTPVAPAAGTPTGTVTFREGATVLGTATLGPGGTATLTLSNLSLGDHDVVADYEGNPNFAGDTSDVLTQSITQNQPPTAGSDEASTAEDGGGVDVDVLANDADQDGDDLTITGVVDPANGIASIDDQGTPDPSDDVVHYVPDADFFGTDVFTYTVDDGHGATAQGSISVIVSEVNDAPRATNDTLATDEDSAKDVNVIANDEAGPANESSQGLHVTVTADPQHGTVSCTDAGVCTYTPATNYHGSDGFTYQVCDDGTTNGTADPLCVSASVDITVTSQPDLLTIDFQGAGTGSVTGPGVNCTADCTVAFADGASPTLHAAAGTGQAFGTWTGCDSTSGADCTVTMDGPRTVVVRFILAPRTLTLTVTGPGTLRSDALGIVCRQATSPCSFPIEQNTQVPLTAVPDSSVFAELTAWGGACRNVPVMTNLCTVTMTRNLSASAAFLPRHLLTVAAIGTGGGTVVSGPAGVNCSTSQFPCSARFRQGTKVDLTATADATSALAVSWTGCNSVQGTKCTVTVDSAKTVTVTFTRVVVQIAAPATAAAEGTSLGFTVSVNTPPGRVVTVPYVVQPGTATAGADYAASLPPTPVQIPANGSAQTISVPTVNDLLEEPAENLSVQLGAPTSAVLGTSSAVGTIAADLSDVCTQVGTDGADLLVGDAGDDYLCGLAGNDRLIGLGGNDTLHGGAGSDWAEYGTAPNRVTGSLSNAIAGVGSGTDDLISIENFRGSAFNDVVNGSDAANRMEGLDGADTMNGGRGDDTISGGGGDDDINGGAGGDDVGGGDGDDEVHGNAGPDLVNGNDGVDHLFGEDQTDALHGGTVDNRSGRFAVQRLDCGDPKNDRYSNGPPGEVQVNCEVITGA